MLNGISRHTFDMSQLLQLEGKQTVQTAHCNADLTHFILQTYYET